MCFPAGGYFWCVCGLQAFPTPAPVLLLLGHRQARWFRVRSASAEENSRSWSPLQEAQVFSRRRTYKPPSKLNEREAPGHFRFFLNLFCCLKMHIRSRVQRWRGGDGVAGRGGGGAVFRKGWPCPSSLSGEPSARLQGGRISPDPVP